MPTRGVLLANLGSPAACDTASVRAYLDEFLMDPFVMDVAWPLRRLIVSAFILPTRPKRSAAAYASIWRDEEPGSPLVYHGQMLAHALAARISMPVALGMRYGAPSFETALTRLAEVDEVLLIPLFPHHADSTRTTSIHRVRALVGDRAMRVLPPFYAEDGYIDALVATSRATVEQAEHVLFSYHGLPERHLTKADPTGNHCLASQACCEKDSAAHATCYRHQCFVTTRRLVDALGIESHSTSFQSRLGRLPWLQPYTNEVLVELARSGVRHLAVICPAFTADNLETLEEIGIAGRRIFLDAGGERLDLTPCLNACETWVDTLANWCEQPPDEAPFDRA
ncbi:MAG: ferrochelatase [Gammaproteobacteria bacterium]|nr:ferrochelatase [Gammaproteobacteria bacterium]